MHLGFSYRGEGGVSHPVAYEDARATALQVLTWVLWSNEPRSDAAAGSGPDNVDSRSGVFRLVAGPPGGVGWHDIEQIARLPPDN